jgi:aspartate racemase
MKTIGLIGGTTWVSTLDYYRAMNEGVNHRLGKWHSAKLLLYSVDFQEYKPDEHTDWLANGKKLGAIARRLQDAGADCILLGANTMHLMADTVTAFIDVPLIHVVTETAKTLRDNNISTVALLGTRFTMEQPFYREKLLASGITPLIPSVQDREYLHNIIFEELGKDIFRDETRQRFVGIIHELMAQGAQGVILGCTEFPLLVKQKDSPLPLFDTVAIHAAAAVEFALGDH